MKVKSVYILSDFRGWILEAIAQESAATLNSNIKIIYIPTKLKDLLRVSELFDLIRYRNQNELTLFINQATYFRVLKSKFFRSKPENSRVYYTHKAIGINDVDEAKKLSQVEKILTNNAFDMNRLIHLEVNRNKVQVIYGAVDRNTYFPTKKFLKKSAALPYTIIVGNCKERKNPRLVYEVIKRMNKMQFIIHGNGWKDYFYKNDLTTFENLKILDFDKNRNPELMRNAHVYLSLANLEGGPYTTLEALASGTPVVATDTGFNSDFLNSSNGVLLPIDVDVFQVEQAINQAFALKEKIGHLDLLFGNFTWSQLAYKLYN